MKRFLLNSLCPLGLTVCLVGLNGCDDKQNAPSSGTSEDNEAAPSQPTPGAAPEGTPAPTPSAEARAAEVDTMDCPSGRWLYDYGDNALEAMISQIPSAKLTREEGSFICTIDKGSSGKVSCAAEAGKPVMNEISATQAGMPFVLLMEISGGTTSKFVLNDDGTMTMSNTDMSGFNIKATATIAGKSVPFPAKEFATAFAPENASVKVAYKCEENTLKLLPQVDGSTVWQVLKRVP